MMVDLDDILNANILVVDDQEANVRLLESIDQTERLAWLK